MLNSPMLSIFQHFHAIPLRSPLISLRSKLRLTGFSRRFTPKNPVRLHNPFGELPRWGAKKVLPLNLIALPNGEGCDTRMLLFSHCQNKYTHMWKKNNDGQSLPLAGNAIKLSGRTFLAPHRGSSPKGRGGYAAVSVSYTHLTLPTIYSV